MLVQTFQLYFMYEEWKTCVSTLRRWSILYVAENVALYKPCSSSSSYSDSSFPFGDCRGALNRNEYITPNRTRSNQPYKPNCFSTTSTDSNPFWSVDLKYNYLVHRVTVFAYDKGQLEKFWISDKLYNPKFGSIFT